MVETMSEIGGRRRSPQQSGDGEARRIPPPE